MRILSPVALLPWALGSELVAAAATAPLLHGHLAPRTLGLWGLVWAIGVLLSLAVWLRWRHDGGTAAQDRSALFQVCAVTALRGSVWGVGLAVLAQGAGPPALPAATVLFALQTASVVTTGAVLPVFGAGLAASVLPWSLGQVLGRAADGGWTVAVGLCFAGLLLLLAWQADRQRRSTDVLRARLREAIDVGEARTLELRAAQQLAENAVSNSRRAAEERVRFLAAASHDLRQPVHAIGLFVSALREEVREGRARYLVDRLERSMVGLDELFNRLLEIARLDSGKITPTFSSFAVAPVLQTLESRFAPLADRRGLRFRLHPAPTHWVRSDPALLIEMLMNLLSNALRYTDEGGILLGTRRRGERLLVQVWDTGFGIERHDLPAIFDEFVQLKNVAGKRRGGLGLGLSIVRRLGDVLDCPVSVRSRPGRGSVFQVSIPLVPEPVGAGLTETAGASSLDGLLVLVVDDEMDVLVGMEASLTSWGCFVLLARSVEEVRQHLTLTERFPDLLITDHRLLADETSEDVVAAVRELVPVAVPVLVVSGDADPELEAGALRRGWSWMSKPANPDRLRTLVARAAGAAAGTTVE